MPAQTEIEDDPRESIENDQEGRRDPPENCLENDGQNKPGDDLCRTPHCPATSRQIPQIDGKDRHLVQVGKVKIGLDDNPLKQVGFRGDDREDPPDGDP